MSAKPNGPPKDQPWVWQTRALRASDAWRSQSINCRRLIDFLLLEHMSHGGKENGKLHAPERQLRNFGIGAQYIADVVREAEELGLVDCHRGGMRIATRYALTWLALHDGTPASNRWRAYRNPQIEPLPPPKSRNLPNKGKAALPNKGKADGANLPNKGKADTTRNLPNKGKALSRSSYQEGANSLDGEGRTAAPPGADLTPGAAVVPLRSRATEPPDSAELPIARLPRTKTTLRRLV